MKYDHDSKKSGEYAETALARLKKEGLFPTPDIFELWYIYYSGQLPEITRAIDILISNKQKITPERCRELHEKFISDSKSEEVVRAAGNRIQDTIKNVSGAVRDVKNATSEYSGTLEGISGKIKNSKNPEDLQNIVGEVMSTTQNMIDRNKALEDQLDQSSFVMDELKKDLENVRREALTDGLTGLANRKAFDAEIARITQEAAANRTSFTLLMVDIDYFKSFNDNFGHQIGDQVLRLVARTLVDGVKGRDLAARYGGEEFVIILPETELQAGIAVGNSLRRSLATKDVVNRNTGEKLGRITMSAGVAEYCPGEDYHDTIERADAALYTAKHNGRNQVAAAPTPNKLQQKRDAQK